LAHHHLIIIIIIIIIINDDNDAVYEYASVEKRAQQLQSQLFDIRERFNSDKLNIIAHSMGGLDARYAITHLKAHEVVASLTTIGTPHRGSPYAEW
jgi:triacylglycerol lipase